MKSRSQPSGERGIRIYHRRTCAWVRGVGECDCAYSYQALGGSVAHGSKSKPVRAHFDTIAAARAWREESRARCKDERDRRKEIREKRRASARRATDLADIYVAERRAADYEGRLAALKRERERTTRLLKRLPADGKAAERLWGHIRKGCQDADRAQLAADGMLRVRMRAIYQVLSEAEELFQAALADL